MRKTLPALFVAVFTAFSAWSQSTSFTASPTTGCAPMTVSFTNTGDIQAGTHYYWSFGDGNSKWSYDTSVVQHPVHTYGSPGGRWAYLDRYDASFNWISGHSIFIDVLGSTGNFNASPSDSACPNDAVQFWVNFNATTYSWSFGDGGVANGSNVYHSFAGPGTYNVRLITTSPCGNDTIDGTYKVTTNIKPRPDFSVSPKKVCPGQGVSVYASYNAKTYLFDFGDGTTSANRYPPEHTYGSTGWYYVTLTVTNGCGNDSTWIDSVQVVNDLPFPGSTYVEVDPDSVCPGDQVSMNANYGFKKYVFDYGDGSPEDSSAGNYRNHVYPNTGTYVVKVQITNFCDRDTVVTDTVRVKSNIGFPSNMTINHDDPLCPGQRMYAYLSSSQSYRWYVWQWGDGAKKDSSQWNGLEHVYKNTGNYPIKLTVYNGCGDSFVIRDTAHVVPDAGFNSGAQISGPNMAVCPGQAVNFWASCCYKTYVWDMGDGSPKDSTNNTNKDHYYSSPGTYTVKCRIYNFCGEDTLVQYTQVVSGDLEFPTDPNFTLNHYPEGPKCPGQQVSFNAPWGYQSYVWNFGDGSPVDSTFDAYRNHRFNDTGSYTVTVRIYNHCGNDTLISKVIKIKGDMGFPYDPYFLLNIYRPEVCPGERVSFGVPYGYQYYAFDYGDGTVDSSLTSWREHVYENTGTYSVSVTITNFCGVDTVLTGTVSVVDDLGFPNDPYFIVDVYGSPACPGKKVDICTPYGYESYVYDYGDGSPTDSVTSSCRSHSYSQAGIYNISVRIYNFCGRDTLITGYVEIDSTLEITGSLNIWIDPQRSCPNQEVRMNAPYGYDTYIWTFGDGDTAYGGAYAQHLYDSIGTYVVTVNFANHCGADTTITGFVTIDSSASFPTYIDVWAWPESNCPGDLVSFDTYDGFVAYYWNFGDGKFDTTNTGRIDHSYDSLGSYTVSVTILNGCGNTITRYVTVYIVGDATVGTIDMTIMPNPACPGDNVLFVPDNDGSNYTFWYDFGDGATDTTLGGAEHMFADTGHYTITITAVNGCGRKATIKRNVEITDDAAPVLEDERFGVVSESQYAGCAGDALVFYFFGTYPDNMWDFGDGFSGVATEQLQVENGAFVTIVKHAYSATGSYWAKLTLTNNCGNSVTDSVLVKIGGNLLVDGDLFIEPPKSNEGYTTCTPVTFIGFGGSSFFWNFGDGDTITTISPTVEHTYLTPGNYVVVLEITNACGNSATVSGAVNVSGIGGPQVSASELLPVSCNGGGDGSAVAVTTSGQPPFTFLWDDPAAQTSDTAVSLTAGSYMVTVTDVNGCSTVKTATVTEPVAIVVSTNKVDASCGLSDGSASVSASNGNSPYTYLWSTGSTNGIITNLAKGSYSVTATDALGCMQAGSVNINEAGAPTLSSSSLSNASCYGEADGSVTVGVTGGTPPFTYNWSDGQTDQTAVNLAAGTYLVTVTDSAGCGGVANFTVTQPTEIKLTGSMTKSNCGAATGSASVSVTGGSTPYTYAWSSGGTGTTESPVPAGTYTVTVTDATGCFKTKEVTVENTGSPTIANLLTNASCKGANDGAIDITVTGGTSPYFYNWSNASNSQDISGLAPGLYTLFLQDGAGCVAVRNYTITEPAEVTSTVTATGTTCTQSIGTLTCTPSGGTQPYGFLWSNAETNGAIGGLAPGSYQVTITDANGCTALDTGTVMTDTPVHEICMVTVDSVLEKNVVIWEKTPGQGIASFNVYKEGVVQNQFNLLGNVVFSGVYSEYLDAGSDPKTVAARYRITAVDSCSNESDPGTIHKTMHLGASPGVSGEIVLDWEAYEGMFVPSYRIWRATNLNPTLSVLATVAGSITAYNDWTVNTGIDTVYYVVDVVHASGCTPTLKTKNYNSARSNKTGIVPPPPVGTAGPAGSILSFGLYPNPNRGSFTYSLETGAEQTVRLRLMNLHGQVVWETDLGNVNGKVEQAVSLERKVPGVYFLQVVSQDALLTRKVIIE